MKTVNLFFLFLLVNNMNVYAFNSVEQAMQEMQDKIDQYMKDMGSSIRGPSFSVDSSDDFLGNSKIAKAEKFLKAGQGDWIWYGKVYDGKDPSGTKYIPISLKNSQSGARLMVYVFMAPNGQINLKSRLAFDDKYDIKQEGWGQDKGAKIEGRFDRLSSFEETMPYVPDGSDKTMYALGDHNGYRINRHEIRSIIWMLLEASRFSIKFNSDFFARDTGAARTATFYLDGLEDMILQALVVLSGRLNRNDDPERLLDRFIDETN